MRKAFFFCALLLLAASSSAFAEGMVRITCDDVDDGTDIYIDGKFAGSCPADVAIKEGTHQLTARKVDGDYEKTFEKQIRVVNNSVQKVNLIMSEPRLTAEGANKKQKAEFIAVLRAAEGGNVDSMWKLADLYDAGTAVEKSPAKAGAWREKAKAAVAQSWIQAAEGGRIDAMKEAAKFYDTGYGVEKNPDKANAWRQKAEDTQNQRAAAEKARIKQQKIDEVSFLENTKSIVKSGAKDGFISFVIALAVSPIGMVSDLIAAPTKSTELNQIRNEAALRPSEWAKPDSMIAQAAQQLRIAATTEQPPSVVASK